MIIYNNDNTRLIEVMDGLENGLAINQTFRSNSYEFYKENNNILVRLDGEAIGHLEKIPYGTYEQLRFDNWDKMETFLNFKKEYNKVSSNKNNMDVFDVYVNDWGVLQYGFKCNEFSGLYDLYFMTTGKRVTGLTYEKMDKVLNKELEYHIELLKKHNRI